MMASKIIKWVVMVTALLLMSTYLFLNYQKLLVLSTYWSHFKTGSTAPVASIKRDEEIIYQHRLNITDLFDAAGSRQINIMPVPEDIFAKIGEQIKSTRLIIDEQEFPLSSSRNKSALLAIATDRKIYLVADDVLKPMMTVIWNEQRRFKNIIRCMAPDLCSTLLISSLDWGPLEGPFSDTEFSAARRAMPRGRWVLGPKTSLNIQSKIQQKVWLKISLLAVHPDQEVSFQGAILNTRRLDTQSAHLAAGDRLLTPSVYLVQTDLQAGSNGLDMHYSLWEMPVSEGAKTLAAYITAITVY